MVHFAEINQAPPHYSMLQYISDIETCVKKLSQILANNIDNGGRGIGLRIYVRYCRLLSTESECASCLTSCRTTND